MKILISYFENEIDFQENYIHSIEIENKEYFYRFVSELNRISNGEVLDEIKMIENNKEIALNNRIQLIFDYFNFSDLNSKKTLNDSCKFIKNTIEEADYQQLLKEHRKIKKKISKILAKVDIPFQISEDLNIEELLKMLKLAITPHQSLLHNLLLLIDINRIFNNNKIQVFINVKNYLNKEELLELYKYAVYNSTYLLLIDSQTYGPTIYNEKKLIIDSNLDEFLL